MQDGKDAPATSSGETSRRCEVASAASASGGTCYLIFGQTRQHRTFRPSDWPERLAGVVALFVDERGTRAKHGRRQFASPVVHNGVKSLRIDGALRDACPDAFTFVSNFAAENELPMHEHV